MPEENISREKSQYKIWEPLLLAIMVVVGMFAGQKMGSEQGFGKLFGVDRGKSSDGQRLEEIIHFIEERYVEDLDTDQLVEAAIQSVIKELDPHSVYLPPQLSADLARKMDGKFEGIGVEFFTQKDTIILSYIMTDGPAAAAGLKIGDRLLSANEQSLTGPEITSDIIKDRLKDKKGTKVDLEVYRPNQGRLNISLVRDEIPISSISASEMMDDRTGYIKIDRFGSKTYQEFMDAIEHLVDEEKMQNVIIDVRKNPGGFLQPAVNILSQLFEERNKLLLYTEGENSKRTEYKTTGNQFFKVDKVAVLIDKNSASASEILAGAIQDHDRGIIIGQQSYGKGLVQEEYGLANGGSLRLTIARYYTPSGRLIQRPYDAEGDPGHSDYYDHNGDKSEGDTTHYFTEKGRVVYGNGGVAPDISIAPLIDFSDSKYNYLYQYLTSFSTHYIVSKTASLKHFDDFLFALNNEENIQEDFLNYANENKISEGKKLRMSEEAANEILLSEIIKASILSHRFGYEKWYEVLNDVDPVALKALEIINSESLYTEQLD